MEVYNIGEGQSYEVLMESIRKKIKYCWNSCIKQEDVELWLDNFKGKVFEIDEERILALMLLNNFIYLRHDEVLHLCKELYYEYIHRIAQENAEYEEILSNTMFYPIGNPSESSSLISYFFRISNGLASDKFSHYPTKLDSDSRYVFIDDISGSGQQAGDYISEFLKNHPEMKKQVSYMTLIGTKKAVEIFGGIGIWYKAASILDDRMKLFSPSSYTKFSTDEINALTKLICGYRQEVKWNPFGYRESELAFGFYYNVPDNSLPIFWADNGEWKSIFKRFHKKYSSSGKGEVFDDRDRFI